MNNYQYTVLKFIFYQ